MKSTVFSTLVMLLAFTSGIAGSQEIGGEVVRIIDDQRVEISVGAENGVQQGMRGRIWYWDEELAGRIYVAILLVSDAGVNSSIAVISDKVAEIKPGYKVEWIRNAADVFLEGIEAFDEGKFDEAIRLFEETKKLDAALAEICDGKIADVRARVEELRKAEEDRLRLLREQEYNRLRDEARQRLHAEEAKKRAEEEERRRVEEEKRISQEKARVPVYRIAARDHLKNEQYKEAKNMWEKILAVDPDDSEALDGIERCDAVFGFSGPLNIEIRPGVHLTLIPIRSGSFLMGTDKGNENERPQHAIRIDDPFWIGQTEITQRQWSSIMKQNVSYTKSSDRPVDSVTWNEANEFCRQLSRMTGRKFRLPTEAEWEYACAAGASTTYFWGDSPKSAYKYTWNSSNAGGETHPVMKKEPNPWGLYDMNGNVSEWCLDVYSYYSEEGNMRLGISEDDPRRVVRGGDINLSESSMRTSVRNGYGKDSRLRIVGFRVVCEIE